MISTMRDKYKLYKECGDYSLNYDEILLFYPDYFKTKVEFEQLNFISKEEAFEYFENHYKDSRLYKKLFYLAMDENDIYQFMKHNMEFKYSQISLLFKKAVKSVIELCELIDYMGHYPKTWPVPKEEEKNKELEKLLEKYDIIIRYYLYDDIDEMQITSDDVVRIIETLKTRIEYVFTITKKTTNNDWLLERKVSNEKFKEIMNRLIENIEYFPISNYQEKGKSKREEGKMYLRKQHGKNII